MDYELIDVRPVDCDSHRLVEVKVIVEQTTINLGLMEVSGRNELIQHLKETIELLED